MKREIKFRAFIKNEIGGFIIPDEDSDCFIVSNGNGFTVYDEYKNTLSNDRFHIMQFTGLKDKNGIDIYEGDILDSGGKYGYLGELVFVCWNEAELAWCVNTKDNDYRDRLRSCFSDKSVVWEVVGNIYENPDKLKNGK